MKKLIQEFRVALLFNGQPKDNSVKELQLYIDRKQSTIDGFFKLFDEIERKEKKHEEQFNKLVNITEAIIDFAKKEQCKCKMYWNGVSFTTLTTCDKCKNEREKEYQQKIAEFDTRIQYLKDLDSLTQKYEEDRVKSKYQSDGYFDWKKLQDKMASIINNPNPSYFIGCKVVSNKEQEEIIVDKHRCNFETVKTYGYGRYYIRLEKCDCGKLREQVLDSKNNLIANEIY